jgi:DNA-binding response OmpR family regulator
MPRILVIDDDRDILEIIKLELEDDLSCTVDICPASKTAIDLVKKRPYDVIIADWRMPVMNGTSLVRALRAAGCLSSIIIYSGKGMGPDIQEALDCGADHYLNRTGDPDSEFTELKSLVKNAVSRKSVSGGHDDSPSKK